MERFAGRYALSWGDTHSRDVGTLETYSKGASVMA